MKTHIILGPESDLESVAVWKDSLKKNNKKIVQHGDGENYFNCKTLKVNNHDRAIILTHGVIEQKKHWIDLCEPEETSSVLKKLFPKTIIHLELVSCYGGEAINSINNLPLDSTLITLTDNEDPLNSSLITEVFFERAKLAENDNPFINFAYYLMLNPDHNKFAIRTKNGPRIFNSSSKKLNEYSASAIKEWQKKKLTDFIIFCQEIKNELDQENKKSLNKLISFLESIDNFVDSFNINRYRELLFINSAKYQNKDGIEKILKSGVNINSLFINDSNALHTAAAAGNLEAVKVLIDNKIDIDRYDNQNETPLLAAIIKNNFDIVKLLISKGASLEAMNLHGGNPVWIAAQSGYLDIVKFLKSKGVSIDKPDNNGATPLFIAIQKKNFPLVKFLIKQKVQINIQNKDGGSPFIMAIQSGETELVKLLFNAGADITIADKYGVSPISMASYLGYEAIVKFLISKGADVNHSDNKGTTPLMMASQQNYPKIVEHLIKAKANLNHKDFEGANALFYASRNQNTEIIKLLLAAGIDSKIKYKGNSIIDLPLTKEIAKEVKKFNKDPIDYILKNNKFADQAIDALRNLETHSKLTDKFDIIEKCIQDQSQDMILDLYSLCGQVQVSNHEIF